MTEAILRRLIADTMRTGFLKGVEHAAELLMNASQIPEPQRPKSADWSHPPNF